MTNINAVKQNINPNPIKYNSKIKKNKVEIKEIDEKKTIGYVIVNGVVNPISDGPEEGFGFNRIKVLYA